jgi:hypothetical protein
MLKAIINFLKGLAWWKEEKQKPDQRKGLNIPSVKNTPLAPKRNYKYPKNWLKKHKAKSKIKENPSPNKTYDQDDDHLHRNFMNDWGSINNDYSAPPSSDNHDFGEFGGGDFGGAGSSGSWDDGGCSSYDSGGSDFDSNND